jgi:hypothetical protein
VSEYLIRTAESHDWPAVHRSQLERVLTPTGFDCARVDGWGDYRLKSGEAEIAYSGEEIG